MHFGQSLAFYFLLLCAAHFRMTLGVQMTTAMKQRAAELGNAHRPTAFSCSTAKGGLPRSRMKARCCPSS